MNLPKNFQPIIEHIERKFGLDPDSATFLCACVITASMGNAFQIELPGELAQPIRLQAIALSPPSGPDHYLSVAAQFQSTVKMHQEQSIKIRNATPFPVLTQMNAAYTALLREDLKLVGRTEHELNNQSRQVATGSHQKQTHISTFEESHDLALQVAKTLGVKQGGQQLTLRPLMLIPTINTRLIDTLPNWSFDQCLFLHGRGPRALEKVITGPAKDMRKVQDFIRQANAHQGDVLLTDHANPLPPVYLSHLLSFTPGELSIFLHNSKFCRTSIADISLFLPPVKKPLVKMQNSFKWLRRSMIRNRLAGLTQPHRIPLDEKAFHFYQQLLKAQPGINSPELLDRIASHLPVHALRLAASLSICGSEEASIIPSISEEGLKHAFDIVERIYQRAEPYLLQALTVQAPEEDIEEKIRVMVEKVKEKGPLRFRQLSRSYHNQNSAELRRILIKAVERQLLQINSEDMILVTELSARQQLSAPVSANIGRENLEITHDKPGRAHRPTKGKR